MKVKSRVYSNQSLKFGKGVVKFVNGEAEVSEELYQEIVDRKFPNIFKEGEEPEYRTKFEEQLRKDVKDGNKEFEDEIKRLKNIIEAQKSEINRKDGEIELKLHGDGLGVLIGKHGQTLDSLQYLTNLAANKGKKEWHRIVLDAENYRKRRRDTLEKLAHNLAHRVKRTGRKALLEPMNPYERKIVHEALQNEPGIVTYSEGEEPYRKVVIDLK